MLEEGAKEGVEAMKEGLKGEAVLQQQLSLSTVCLQESITTRRLKCASMNRCSVPAALC